MPWTETPHVMPHFQLDCPTEMSWRRHCPPFSPMLEATSNHTTVPVGCAVGKLGPMCSAPVVCGSTVANARRSEVRLVTQDRHSALVQRVQHKTGECPRAAPHRDDTTERVLAQYQSSGNESLRMQLRSRMAGQTAGDLGCMKR